MNEEKTLTPLPELEEEKLRLTCIVYETIPNLRGYNKPTTIFMRLRTPYETISFNTKYIANLL